MSYYLEYAKRWMRKQAVLRWVRRKLKGPPSTANRQVTRHGDFEVATTPNAKKTGYLVWSKMGKITGSCPFTEPGDPVWMDYGRTREEARGKVLAELGMPQEKVNKP
jgi:hypothetical protein